MCAYVYGHTRTCMRAPAYVLSSPYFNPFRLPSPPPLPLTEPDMSCWGQNAEEAGPSGQDATSAQAPAQQGDARGAQEPPRQHHQRGRQEGRSAVGNMLGAMAALQENEKCVAPGSLPVAPLSCSQCRCVPACAHAWACAYVYTCIGIVACGRCRPEVRCRLCTVQYSMMSESRWIRLSCSFCGLWRHSIIILVLAAAFLKW